MREMPKEVSAFMDDRAVLTALLHDAVIGLNDLLILELIRQKPNTRQSDLIHSAHLPRSTTSRTVVRLLDLELASERLAPADLRASQLKITARGENVLYEAAHAISCKTLETYARGEIALNAARGECGLSQTDALVVLGVRSNGCDIDFTELKQATACQSSKLHEAIFRLRKKGLLDVRKSKEDRRKTTVMFTCSGSQTAEELLATFQAFQSHLPDKQA